MRTHGDTNMKKVKVTERLKRGGYDIRTRGSFATLLNIWKIRNIGQKQRCVHSGPIHYYSNSKCTAITS